MFGFYGTTSQIHLGSLDAQQDLRDKVQIQLIS